jgi:hypothetical protein
MALQRTKAPAFVLPLFFQDFKKKTVSISRIAKMGHRENLAEQRNCE